MTVHYIHMRDRNQQTLSDANGKAHIDYKKGGVCIAYRLKDEQHIEYAFAACSPDDNYNKKEGRSRAFAALSETEDRLELLASTGKQTFNGSELFSNDLFMNSYYSHGVEQIFVPGRAAELSEKYRLALAETIKSQFKDMSVLTAGMIEKIVQSHFSANVMTKNKRVVDALHAGVK